ncbi:MAG: hypothetical protein HZA17_02870, partial [Nitrospirae bacterium]|nr:hypothetical protein [Nitrospirota bacterium]
DLAYLPKNNLSLSAGVSHTLSSGDFYPALTTLTQPVSVASFSKMKIKETVYSVEGEYRFKNGFASSVQYKYSDFNDVLDNPHDDVDDGKVHIVLLTLSKRW